MSSIKKELAKHWVEQALAFYKMSGRKIALAAFTDPAGMFVNGELYIFALDPEGVMLAHGINHRFVGKEFIDLKDSDGKPFIREIVDTAKAKGKGWIEYKWYNPVKKKWLSKTVYFENIDNVIICSGVYAD